MPSRDDELMERAIGGDSDALGRLLEQHSHELRCILQPELPARWKAELALDDVMQETYLDAALSVSSFEPRCEGAFKAWLLTLARRDLIDAIRGLEAEKRGRGHLRIRPTSDEGSLLALFDLLDCDNLTPSQATAVKERAARLKDAMEKLPATYRAAVQMYDLDGEDIERVAEKLNRRPGAVFMLRARALRMLRDLMGTPSQFFTGTG